MAIHIALILLISWLSAGVVNGIVIASRSTSPGSPSEVSSESPLDAGVPLRDYTAIFRRNIFNSESTKDKSSVDETRFVAGAGAGTDAPISDLNLKLTGTMVWENFSLAVIRVGSGAEETFRLHEMVSGAKIVGIERNRVMLLNNGRLEALEVDFNEQASSGSGRFTPGARKTYLGTDVMATGDGANISKGYLEAQLKNMNQLLTQVRAVPNMDSSGVTNGFKLFAVRKDSIFDKIGLKDQDVVQSINGVELNSAEKGLELFQVLRNESYFNVDILRGNQKSTLRFNVQ